MKKIAYLFFATIITLIFSSTGFSQGNQGGNNGEQGRQYEYNRRQLEEYERSQAEERNLARREQELREKESKKLTPLDYERLRQIQLNKALNEFDLSGDALLIAVKVPGKKGFKDSAKLAERIATLSKDFRKELNKKSAKAGPAPVPAGEDRSTQLFQLAEVIDKRIDQVIYPLTEALHSFSAIKDDSQLEETCKQLEEIERIALSLRQVARGKN